MKLHTSRFGEIDIETEKLLTFTQGIPGFEDKHSFIMLHPDAEIPFSFMQSAEDGNLAFLVTDPFLYFPDYQFDLPEGIQQEVNIQQPEEIMIRSIVSIHPDTQEFALNLLAPIIVNTKEKLGKQVILHHSSYKTKHPIQPGTSSKEEQSELKEV
ncbi:flagellar assembly protein FliW [Paenibacillus eucommiae]|uniref:Flagellar assembly factor FliW n=1 Tax=Paenibacillus eucommiae TaxID=1355755 RepID=A0ABS4IYI8_9BACL|nr:flagellar assembly protein FliW [Paenibacillus eucommiae]MBP1992643.1 flagellar assembly factor FliW [Paenibacillus eucommiae]